jgi:hypothetical protein
MGHLLFIGLFGFLLVLLISRIYFGYLFARRKKPSNTASPIEIPLEGRRFQVRKGFGFFAVVFIVIFLAASICGSYKLWQNNDPGFWLVTDSIVPITLLFGGLAVKGFLSYIFVDRDGFKYREFFRIKRHAREDIEDVCRDNEFIFVKCGNKQIPVIIENMYGNKEIIYGMLCMLKETGNKRPDITSQ